MSLYLLDTDTVSLAQFGHPLVLQRINAQPPADVALSVITIQEQASGWQAGILSARNPPQIAHAYARPVERLFPVWRRLELFSFTQPAIQRFEDLRKLRLNVGSMDLRIAAIALENGLIVVSRNQRDFGRVPGLVLDDWSV
jgi:tRNA(fMet)-specific endonuclease VapC